ncbi:MarR family transcriptional regulator [Hyphomonas sp. FCG-A18]|uniref:MarR family winged helix-turn-helix transcriptional regulator n=1 Tax=Hyphomonas sp. FCG-A18 TaxID=3080019 RepID=UPI002B2EACB2|nr:MarR family transcriptional regulator [Hyphomonas sp. FCG-A18]
MTGFEDKTAIGKRLRQLSSIIDSDANQIYTDHNKAFEQKWFGVINQLMLNGQMSVSSLAKALGVSHVSISKVRKSLETANLIEARQNPDDARQKDLQLTSTGEALARELYPLWQAFEAASEELNEEAGNIIAALTGLQEALNRKSLYDRVEQHLKAQSKSK